MAPLIQRVAVIGSGTMGGALAAHFANAGLAVSLLDIIPDRLTPAEEQRHLTLADPAVRNRIVTVGIEAIKKSKPAALYTPQVLARITPGNLEDDFDCVAHADWIVEAVVENLTVKRCLMERIDAVRRDTSLVTTNTSGIPIAEIAAGRSDSFCAHFLGTHFFNPPRYLKLLEIIPGPRTAPEVVECARELGENVLGKGVVVCHDRPNFIANRLGTYAAMVTLHYALEHGYSVNQVDAITGPVVGHPKTATFRLLDLVGNDVMLHVADNLYASVPDDEEHAALQAPEFLREMVARGLLGIKAGQGFYKQVRTETGREYRALNLQTLAYEPQGDTVFESTATAEIYDDLGERLRYIVAQADRGAALVWQTTARYLAYATRRVPEIADDIVAVDNAMKWGFGHAAGPFELFDQLGVAETVARMNRLGITVAPWVHEMLAGGCATFYSGGRFYDPGRRTYVPLPAARNVMLLREQRVIKSNDSASLLDLGDGVAGLEFHSKMNALDEGIVEIAAFAVEQVERNFAGLVVGNQGEHFCAGANIMMIGMAANEARWDDIDRMARSLQSFLMAFRYSPKPVVTAPFGYTLGGGCEVAMHGARAVAHAETYIGLVEAGLGLLPAGGGCTELLRRIVSPAMETPNADPLPWLQRVFELIGLAKVATSAEEGRQYGFFGPADRVVMNRDHQIAQAKRTVLDLVAGGYRPPVRGDLIYAGGERMLAALRLALYTMRQGRYISEHDAHVGDKIAFVLCGGSLTAPTWVTEQYIMDLEREAFVSLCGEHKTRERIWHFLSTGKPLRN